MILLSISLNLAVIITYFRKTGNDYIINCYANLMETGLSQILPRSLSDRQQFYTWLENLT